MGTIKLHFEAEAFVYGSAAFPQYNKVNGTNFPVTGLYFDATTEETAYLRFRVPNYGTGSWTINLNWYADSASSGGISAGISVAAITPNTDTQDVETKAFATETVVSDTHLGTVAQRSHDVQIAISNLDSVVADDEVVLRIARKVADAGDTMSGDWILKMLDISYSDT